MSDPGSLEALQALHRDLVSVCERRFESLQLLEQSLQAHAEAFKTLLDKPARDTKSRTAVQSGRIKIADTDYKINQDFQESALKLADELNLDEIQAAKVLLESNEDRELLGRPLLECGIIRFHQQRKYLLDCMRLCIRIANDEDLDSDLRDGFGAYVSENIYREAPPGGQAASPQQKIVPRCMSEMLAIKTWLQKLSERAATVSLLQQGAPGQNLDFEEAVEFSRVSLIQQHELLAVVMCSAIEKQQADVANFKQFLQILQKGDRYDHLLVHLLPSLGAYITAFGSTESQLGLREARQLNAWICNQAEDDSWTLVYVRAAVRAWWTSEYSGWYLDDPMGSPVAGVDLDEEDRERSKQFMDALKDGAFDFLLSVAADAKTVDWHDPARSGMRQWLQRLSPPLMTDSIPFSNFFQDSLAIQLETLIDAFISNLPDVLRKMRTEEDEQRQLSQSHEHDPNFERFLLIIAYAYDGRPTAAETFWREPESNLAGFLHWASKRASTPLVSAFCEMLLSLSSSEEWATAAHHFLLDETHHSSGKMRRTLSLTWKQVFKELVFFTNKIRERPTPPQSQIYRGGKMTSEQAETEPESAMMLECYLRLITKLASESEQVRVYLLKDPTFNLVEILYQLASSLIPARLRACAFYALKALLSRKSQDEGSVMWRCLDTWMTGGYLSTPGPHRGAASGGQSPTTSMEAIFEEIGDGFEEPNAFIQFLISLVTPVEGYESLGDSLPFPEDLGSAVRMPGIELYVDFVLGHVFAFKSKEVQDPNQLRMLRLSCLEFAFVCLSAFNEDLILIANESNIAVDAAIATTDLATYVRLHPFARVMEWMFNDKVMDALFDTIHQDGTEVGNASPDSPLLQGILKGVEVMTKVLELQDTYLDLVRPLIKLKSGQRRQTVANAAYASFEDGIMNHLDLVVDLGRYCGVGYAPLTLAGLKLLEMVSSSPKLTSAWNPGPGHQGYRNKAVVALEANGDAEAIAASLVSELIATLDLGLEAEAPNYLIKKSILDFLYSCLRAAPSQPTIAHQLLGFKCEMNSLSIASDSSFESSTSLFHNIFKVLLESPYGDDELGMREWLIALKFKTMRIFQVLWSSPLSSSLIIEELRTHDFLFLLLIREVVIQPDLPWDGVLTGSAEFLVSDASVGYINFLALRAMMFEYVGIELCSVSQTRLPSLKRRIFDALNGQIVSSEKEPVSVPNVFDFFDFLPVEGQLEIAPPDVKYYRDVDLRSCVEQDPDSGPQYNVDRVREILLLKRNEARSTGQVIPQSQLSAIEKEEVDLLAYLICSNRQKQIAAYRLKVLRAWASLLLVMFETTDLKGAAQVSFLLQALQVILPSLETFSSTNPEFALELAKLAKVLLFKLDFSTPASASTPNTKEVSRHGISHLLGDKLFQLFQICLNAIGKSPRSPELRSLYYSICYRYLTAIVDEGRPETSSSEGLVSGVLGGSRQRALEAVNVYGERLLTICDDALGGDAGCQIAALILLGALVNLGRNEDEAHVVEILNGLNFIGILVDSLKTMLQEWLEVIRTDNVDQQHCYNAKLALLQQLCQTRDGAKYVSHANLFRALELSGLFSADPELEIDPTDIRAMTLHYGILVKAARIVGAAVVSRGAHNVLQGRRFLTEHRMLVTHTLKRSAGIGAVGHHRGGGSTTPPAGGNGSNGTRSREQLQLQAELEEDIEELAEAFMVLITATEFLEFDDQQLAQPERRRVAPTLFH